MTIGEGPDRVASLALEPGGTFSASLKEQQHLVDGSCESLILTTAFGAWQQCRGGVELVFREAPELDLPELLITYRLRRGCLVAESLDLPDGLAQEYSRCPDGFSAVPLAPERLSLIERMLADATVAAGGPEPLQPSRAPASAATTGALPIQCPSGESDAEDCSEVVAPVDIISDGSNSDGEESTGGGTPRCPARARPCPRESTNSEKPQEEYCDDFEGESDGEV
jgi:hypothetical protein